VLTDYELQTTLGLVCVLLAIEAVVVSTFLYY